MAFTRDDLILSKLPDFVEVTDPSLLTTDFIED